MVEFADTSGLKVRLVYYPPYHSKYNGIERYWAGLEESWNGYLLSTVKNVLNRAANFFWKGARARVRGDECSGNLHLHGDCDGYGYGCQIGRLHGLEYAESDHY